MHSPAQLVVWKSMSFQWHTYIMSTYINPYTVCIRLWYYDLRVTFNYQTTQVWVTLYCVYILCIQKSTLDWTRCPLMLLSVCPPPTGVDLHLCSMSLIVSGMILSLSMCSRTTLAHFCNESIAIQGLDMSTTSRIIVLAKLSWDTANFWRPLWYRSPSNTQALHLVWST